MTEPVAMDEFLRTAPLVAAQLSVLTTLGTGPVVPLESTISERPSGVFDLDGELLFWRARVESDGATGTVVDVAAHPALAAPLVAVSHGVEWVPEELVERARAAVDPAVADRIDEARFVAYSFPKVAVQFLAGGEEVALIELFSWLPVPVESDRRPDEGPGNFERWSFLRELPRDLRAARYREFEERLVGLTELAERIDARDLRVALLDRDRLLELLRPRTDRRDLHFSTETGDHSACFELRGQQTNVWCVAASVQMVLDFYRYDYPQTRIAAELGLGTLANPSGLLYSQDGMVVTVLEQLTSNALDAAMNTTPTFGQFRGEIRANRPLVSFIPGHSRAVAGYTRTVSLLIPAVNFNGLLVYDPWPPNAGVVSRWENFDTQVYRRTFTARVTLV